MMQLLMSAGKTSPAGGNWDISCSGSFSVATSLLRVFKAGGALQKRATEDEAIENELQQNERYLL